MTTTTNITVASEAQKDATAITRLLADLGKVLLKDKRHTDWLDVDALSTLCKQHHMQLGGGSVTLEELESALRHQFQDRDELHDNGINVTGYPRRIRWELVFMVRFDRYHPLNPLPACDEDLEPACVPPNVNN